METIMSVGPAPNTSGNAFVGPEDCTAACNAGNYSDTSSSDTNNQSNCDQDVCPVQTAGQQADPGASN